MDTEQALLARLQRTEAKLNALIGEAKLVAETWPAPPFEMMVRLLDAIDAAEQ